jgi:hypothetical protein
LKAIKNGGNFALRLSVLKGHLPFWGALAPQKDKAAMEGSFKFQFNFAAFLEMTTKVEGNKKWWKFCPASRLILTQIMQ